SAADGTTKVVSFTINGVNDAAVIGTPTVASVTEDSGVTNGNLVATGSISITDTDTGEATFATTVVKATDALGALVLNTDGTYTYTVANAAVQSLAQSETHVDTFTVSAADGTTKVVSFTINGVNDAPVVSAAVTGTATEDGAKVTLDALANATDVDHGAVLSVVSVPTTLPAGVSYDATSHSFTLDPTNAAYQALAQGQQQTVSVTYAVSDGTASVAQTASFVVTGVNDAPVAINDTAALVQRTSVIGNVLINDRDIDTGDTLQVGQIGHGTASATVTTAGVQLVGDYGTVTIKSDGSYAYAASKEGTLAVGATGTDAFTYSVSDNHGGTTTAALSFTVTGSAQGDAGNNIIIAAAGSNTLSGGA
ncbi:VCBS domain-containing protein, partial [Methylobacterium cerastii]|uniref:VCBS domain-containing protein n=1 Tax=Methylobacterium cerastii TaxID=932741 RepID=UPI0024B4A2A8